MSFEPLDSMTIMISVMMTNYVHPRALVVHVPSYRVPLHIRTFHSTKVRKKTRGGAQSPVSSSSVFPEAEQLRW